VHSEYSLLDGFSNIKKLVARAKEMSMPALALTDHGTLFGVIDFFNAAQKAGIKPIIGMEAYLAPRGMDSRDPQADKKSTHLLLLAENQTGYQNLMKLASRAQLEGFYYYPRVDHALVAEHAEGLICTTGCMSAEVPRLLVDGNLEGARRQLDWYYDTFGKDRFFLELQQHDIKELERINRHLLDLGHRYDSNFVATNDVHYINPEDARLQDILLAIQTGTLLSDPNRMRMTDASYYLRSPEEMGRLFAEVPEALSNTSLIAERCNVDLGFKGYHLPNFDVPEGYTADIYLRSLCEIGLKQRFGERANDPVVNKRLEYELGVIHQMGFDTYFLIVWDLCRYARDQGIWYNARGSAAGSIVAYTLEITLVDPIEHGLIFERFLNPGRISMPDIDLDFRDDRRSAMMEYTARKYGDDKVAQIITFGTLGARAAIRDVGRVMDIPLADVDRVAKLVPNIPGKPITIPQALDEVPDFKKSYDSAPYLKELIDTAGKMEGVVRSAGTHAAGVIITDKPIIDYIPLHRPTGSSAAESPIKTVTQFEMNVLDSLGLLKVDFLGLATLTIMAKACDLIYHRHGKQFTLDNIPTNDPETYELLGRGETAGVFQLEGSGMRRWLMEMKPKELKHVVAMVALFRPGPMDFIPGYIRRMHGEEAVEYRHPWLEEIFKETYGYPVYQEQLMFAVMKLADYSAPEADDLRKAIAKKLADKLEAHRQKFIDGAKKNDIPTEISAAIFEEWEEFARYGFNKSHAVDYAVIAVQTAYLKLHYPFEYMTALLSVSKNETAKVALYVADARRMGLGVEPPDINASDWDFSIEDCKEGSSVIRFGLGAVKNVGQSAVEAILKERQNGAFQKINDFARRVDLRLVGRRALECLTKVGALDDFGQRTSLLEALDSIIAVSTSHFRAAESGQISLFGQSTGVVEEIHIKSARNEVSRKEIMNWERELIGLYITDHPLSPIISELEDVVTHYSGQLVEVAHQEHVRLAGIITRIRNHQTKSGQSMAFVTMEDLQGTVDLVIFPRTWERVAELVKPDQIVLVEGKVDASSGDPKVLVDNITKEFIKMKGNEERKSPSANPALSIGVPQKPFDPRAAVSNKPGGASRLPAPVNGQANPQLAKVPGFYQTAKPVEHTSSKEPDHPVDEEDPIVNWEGMPPQPEEPPDWHALTPAVTSETSPLVRVEVLPEQTAHIQIGDDKKEGTPERGALVIHTDEFESQVDIPVVAPDGRPETAFAKPPVILPPLRKPAGADGSAEQAGISSYLVAPLPDVGNTGQVRMLTVVLRSSNDKTRDVLRLRRIHGIIMTYPGDDRFAVQVYENGRGYLLEFPNSTTGITQELLDRLHGMVGVENIRVDVITFH
jgi:DNA polymerase-3 subunit alpha